MSNGSGMWYHRFERLACGFEYQPALRQRSAFKGGPAHRQAALSKRRMRRAAVGTFRLADIRNSLDLRRLFSA